MKAKRMAYLLLVALILSVSCSRNASSTIPIGEQELPDMVMEDALYVLGQPEEKPLSLKAQKITIWSSQRGTMLENVSFERSDEFSGSCTNAVIRSDSRHAVLSGDVLIHQNADDITIRTQSIVWDQDTESFTCDGEVTMQYGQGTTLKALGFYAKFDEGLYEFAQILEGRMSE